ncbi:MAG: UBP-type zinc finger domain-containing protein [Acidobacteriaceae bacterium]|nr:UBP-type zinc finger domain-containing protein [Acidobacteriaceae bacterium]
MACHHFEHLKPLGPSDEAYARGCEECLRMGSSWVHLRQCLLCGHVGCCDSSPNKHATAHFHAVKHSVIRSVEPHESWGWCYVDEVMVDLA